MDGWQGRLTEELERRRAGNPRYGVRAFARQLGVSPAQLSQMLSGKRPVSRRMADLIMGPLGISEIERRLLEQAHLPDHKPTLEEEHFGLIAHWSHFAILCLAEIKDNRADTRWIARRLNLSHQDAREALERLTRLGLVDTVQGRMRPTHAAWQTTAEVASASVRRSHQLHLALAARKLDDVPVELREFTTITMAVNPQKLKSAKALVKKFKQDMEALLESGKKAEVYALAVQLYPLSDVTGSKP